MCGDPESAPGAARRGPNRNTYTMRFLTRRVAGRFATSVRNFSAEACLMFASSYKDFSESRSRALLEKYYRGASARPQEANQALKLFGTAIGTEFFFCIFFFWSVFLRRQHELYENQLFRETRQDTPRVSSPVRQDRDSRASVASP